MSTPSTTTEAPITLGAVHALLTQWRQTHSAKARIPYVLIIEIASLIGHVPIDHIEQTLGISHKQLSYFEFVYRASCRTQAFPAVNQRAPLSVSACAESPVDKTQSCLSPHAGILHTDAANSQLVHDHPGHIPAVTDTDSLNDCHVGHASAVNPHFIKATYAPDAFSTCAPDRATPTTALSSPHEPQPVSIVSEHVSSQNVTPQHLTETPEMLHPIPSPEPFLPPPSDDHARTPITLVNQHGITFTATLSERQTLFFMQTFIQR